MTQFLADPDLAADGWGVRGTVAELAASRARVAASADEQRRHLQRHLHHGVQQRLAHAVIALRLAHDAAVAGHPPTDLIEEALAHAERASRGLDDVVRGTLPTILVHSGLRSGVESVIADLALVADVRVDVPRLPVATETTAYLVIAEALTSIALHAGANRVSVRVVLDGDVLAVEVSDDGRRGADAAREQGFRALIDRVDAVGGTVSITGSTRAGTVLRAALPVESA